MGNFFRQVETSIRAIQLKANVARLTWIIPHQFEPVSAFLGAGKSFLNPAATFPISSVVFYTLASWHVACTSTHFTSSQGMSSLMSQESMRALLSAIFEWIFGCHQRELSRVFTIDHKTYQVCLDCGRKLQYSWRAMSLIKTNETPQTLASFTTAFTQAMNNSWGQSRET